VFGREPERGPGHRSARPDDLPEGAIFVASHDGSVTRIHESGDIAIPVKRDEMG